MTHRTGAAASTTLMLMSYVVAAGFLIASVAVEPGEPWDPMKFCIALLLIVNGAVHNASVLNYYNP